MFGGTVEHGGVSHHTSSPHISLAEKTTVQLVKPHPGVPAALETGSHPCSVSSLHYSRVECDRYRHPRACWTTGASVVAYAERSLRYIHTNNKFDWNRCVTHSARQLRSWQGGGGTTYIGHDPQKRDNTHSIFPSGSGMRLKRIRMGRRRFYREG